MVFPFHSLIDIWKGYTLDTTFLIKLFCGLYPFLYSLISSGFFHNCKSFHFWNLHFIRCCHQLLHHWTQFLFLVTSWPLNFNFFFLSICRYTTRNIRAHPFSLVLSSLHLFRMSSISISSKAFTSTACWNDIYTAVNSLSSANNVHLSQWPYESVLWYLIWRAPFLNFQGVCRSISIIPFDENVTHRIICLALLAPWGFGGFTFWKQTRASGSSVLRHILNIILLTFQLILCIKPN